MIKNCIFELSREGGVAKGPNCVYFVLTGLPSSVYRNSNIRHFSSRCVSIFTCWRWQRGVRTPSETRRWPRSGAVCRLLAELVFQTSLVFEYLANSCEQWPTALKISRKSQIRSGFWYAIYFIISLSPIYNAGNDCGLIYSDIDVEIVARSDLRLRKLAHMFEIDDLADMNSGIKQMKSSTATRRSHLRRAQLMIPMRRTRPARTTKTQKKINRLKLLTPHQLIRVALFIGVGIKKFFKVIVILYSYMCLSNSPIAIFPSFKYNERLHIVSSHWLQYIPWCVRKCPNLNSCQYMYPPRLLPINLYYIVN